MTVARTRSMALIGIEGAVVEIEADVSSGLPNFILVGLPDTALGEARERVRSATGNSGLSFPSHKLTVNLSPAALPKHGSAFDLAIALAALVADGQLPAESVAMVVHLGELGLDGRLRPVPGVLPAVVAAVRAGHRHVMVPEGSADEARLVPDAEVIPVASLRAAAIWHGAQLEPIDVEPWRVQVGPEPGDHNAGDLADIVGNADSVEAAQVAAAGGHHLFLLGPPGGGQDHARRALTRALARARTRSGARSCLHSVARGSVGGQRVASATAVRGSASHGIRRCPHRGRAGGYTIRPGAAVRACHGVLMLDEAPEFASHALDALRQPLESGVVEIARAQGTARFPARFQLVLAANPCPCGNAGSPDAECSCSPMMRRRYLGRLSGPLLDRIDIRVHVPRVSVAQLRAGMARPTSTHEAQDRVAEARDRAGRRLRDTPWRLNAELPGRWLRSEGRLGADAMGPLDRALERGLITMRGHDRVLRLAWTLADLDQVDRPNRDHVGRALLLRRGGA